MNRRLEPRFDVYSPVTVMLLDDPEREVSDCLLADISGSGMRLLTRVDLAEDQMISVEVGQYVVLADVRHCSPRGDKFTIGVERIHTVPAPALAQHTSRIDKMNALVESYHLRIQQGLECALLGPGLIAGEAMPQATDQLPVVPDGSPAVLNVATEGTVEHPVAPQPTENEGSHPEPVNGASNQATVEEDPFDAIRAMAIAKPKTPTRTPGTLSRSAVGAAAGFALVLLVIASMMGASLSPDSWVAALKKTVARMWPTKTVEPVKVVQASGESVPLVLNPAPQDAGPSVPALASAAAPEAVNAPGKQHAFLKVTGTSWVSACSDGEKLFGKLLSPGDGREIEFSRTAVVRVGNASQVQIAMDGKPGGPLGKTGQSLLLELTAHGMRVLPIGDPANDCGSHPAN